MGPKKRLFAATALLFLGGWLVLHLRAEQARAAPETALREHPATPQPDPSPAAQGAPLRTDDPLQAEQAASSSTAPPPSLDGTAFLPATYADAAIPLGQRRAMLRALAARGGAAAVKVLMNVGDGEAYLRWAAVRALGGLRDGRWRSTAETYLRGKLVDADSRTAEAAMAAYGELAGARSVGALAATLSGARGRADGLGPLVAGAGVAALERIATPAAARALAHELGYARQPQSWDYEYGSRVVAALARIGEAAGRSALLAYAALLGHQLPADPMARSYLQTKIAEAIAAASQLAG